MIWTKGERRTQRIKRALGAACTGPPAVSARTETSERTRSKRRFMLPSYLIEGDIPFADVHNRYIGSHLRSQSRLSTGMHFTEACPRRRAAAAWEPPQLRDEPMASPTRPSRRSGSHARPAYRTACDNGKVGEPPSLRGTRGYETDCRIPRKQGRSFPGGGGVVGGGGGG